IDVEQKDHALLLFEIGDPADQLLLLGGKPGSHVDEAGANAHHLGHGIDDETGLHPRDGKDHDALTVVAFDTGQAESPPLIHHRQYATPKVDNSLDEGRRPGHPGEFVGDADDFLDRVDGNTVFLVHQAEHNDFFLVVALAGRNVLPVAHYFVGLRFSSFDLAANQLAHFARVENLTCR